MQGIQRRRILIATSALLAARLGHAQQSQKVRRIGLLDHGSPAASEQGRKRVMDSLERAGYREGDNLVIESRYAEGNPERLPELARELVALKVELIMTTVNPATIAAREASGTIPILMLIGSYPVENGFIKNYQRPGGNITGFDTWPAGTVSEKWYQVLKLAVPNAKIVVNLGGETSPGVRRALGEDFGRRVAERVGLEVLSVQLTPNRRLADALAAVIGLRPDVFAIEGNALTIPRWPEIAAFALKHKLPSISTGDQYVRLGGLLSYGPDILTMLARTGSFVDRILRGASPAELPVEQPTKFRLALNSTTAKAIGITLSPSFMNSVDQVIE